MEKIHRYAKAARLEDLVRMKFREKGLQKSGGEEAFSKFFKPLTKRMDDNVEMLAPPTIPSPLSIKSSIQSTPPHNIKAASLPETPTDWPASPNSPSPPRNRNSLLQAFHKTVDPDTTFGVREEHDGYKIGNVTIGITMEHSITIGTKKYWLKEGLISLLTNKFPSGYSTGDLNYYKEILISTNAMRQNNDPDINNPKSSGSKKWTTIVTHIWSEFRGEKVGQGLKRTSEPNFLPYSSPDQLIFRLNDLLATRKAGNTSHLNEVNAIVDELHNQNYITVNQYRTLQSIL